MKIKQMIISASNLSKSFGPVRAVNDLSLRVEKGEIYGFLGLNGAGKTTTIRMMLGMIRPTSGGIELFGEPVSANTLALWSHVGYLVEIPNHYPELTVRENLEVMRRLRHIQDTRMVDSIIEQLSLTKYANRKAGTLSQGNSQRLGLAKALFHKPDLLVLDEPANGLDPAGVVEIRTLLRQLSEQGVTIFMSSHILSEVNRLATRIGIIHEGYLIDEIDHKKLEQRLRRRLLIDTVDNKTAKSVLEKAGFGITDTAEGRLESTDNDAVQHPENIAKILVEADVPPRLLSVEEEDLESYFLRLVGEGAGGAR